MYYSFIPLIVSAHTIWHSAIPHLDSTIPAPSQHSIHFTGKLHASYGSFMVSENSLTTSVQVIHLEGLIQTTAV